MKASKQIEEAKDEIRAKVADDKEVKKNELSADGKLQTVTKEKPKHTKEFEEAKAYVKHVEDKHDEQKQVVTTPTLKGEWVNEETKEEQVEKHDEKLLKNSTDSIKSVESAATVQKGSTKSKKPV